MRRTALAAFAAAVLGLLSVPALAEPTPDGQRFVGSPFVKDGDTLRFGDVDVRFWGLDTPEYTQTCGGRADGWACGLAARRALVRLIGSAEVTCVQRGYDHKYGRPVAVCTADGVDLNAAMVRGGWAAIDPRFSQDYQPLLTEAKAAGRGVWSGAFQNPWDYRQEMRAKRRNVW